MQLDRIEGKPDETVAWGSDVAAQMLRRLGIPYISLNPGASYRGLHDSLVNHLGNERPGILLCLHEDHSVAIAHGYAKATGEPMACVLHSNVGLLHGMMSLFNAWCDRVPMIVLGATGPLDAEKRRPWIDWIHTSRDQGAFIRSIIKWDDQPSSPQALVESMCRANIATRTAPTAPVYICLDAGLQEARLDKPPEWPEVSRFVPAEPSRPGKSAVDQAEALLARAERPVIMFGRGSRKPEFWQSRIRLAERLGACVVSDLKQGAMFPDRPSGALSAALQCSPQAGARAPLRGGRHPGAGLDRSRRRIAAGPGSGERIGQDHRLPRSTRICTPAPTWNTRRFPPWTYRWRRRATPPSRTCWKRWGRIAARSRGRRARRQSRRRATEQGITMEHIASTLRAEFNDPENVSFCTLGRGWPIDIWPFQNGLSYLGKDGGGGLGSGPGLSVGAALALHDLGRHAISMLGDGDFCMGVTAIWTAVRHRIPLLVLINNNRSYFNDELHQDTVARTRGREVKNRWIGLRMEDPAPDIAKLAEAQGAVGIGPVKTAAEVKAAISKGVAVLKSGGVCVIDFHVDPPPERSDGIGHRPTGA